MVWEKKVEKQCNVDCSIVSHQQSTICRRLTVAIYLIAVVAVVVVVVVVVVCLFVVVCYCCFCV